MATVSLPYPSPSALAMNASLTYYAATAPSDEQHHNDAVYTTIYHDVMIEMK